MTPTFCWVFLLALVGHAASMLQPLVVDACALICNPGAETESERERDPVLFPRYPKVDCKLQSDSQEHQAWVLASNCLKLCNPELSISLEVNCFALRSSLVANLGCYCEALTPLSPNTISLNDGGKMDFLVKELANDILTTISDSPLDMDIICEIHQELFNDTKLYSPGKLDSCYPNTIKSTQEPDPDLRFLHPSAELQKQFIEQVSVDEIAIDGDEESENDDQADKEKEEEEDKQLVKEEDNKPAEDEKDEPVISVNRNKNPTQQEENNEYQFCMGECNPPDDLRDLCDCEFAFKDFFTFILCCG